MQLIDSYSKIDLEQHFKVTAGPGAGKTKFLINHIKNVLHNSERLGRNRKIACITYTNVGVETILKRLGDETNHVEVSTIHSFLFTHIIKPYFYLISDKYGIDPLMVDAPYEHIVSRGFYKKTNLERKYVTEDDLKKIFWFIEGNSCKLHIKGRKGNYHHSLLKYKGFFWERGIIHFDDILAFSWELLNNTPEILRIIRAKFPYFYIDEFQDTNPIQTEIIKLIAMKEVIVGVIGDKAQSIYEFQGADVKQFDNFLLPGMASYKMVDNHRSTQEIINLLNFIRKDIIQKSSKKKTGNLPVILVGTPLQALNHAKGSVNGEDIYTLSFSNLMANSVRNNMEYIDGQKWAIIDEAFEDSDNDRRKFFISIIKAIEYARLSHFKDAIRELSRHLKTTDEFNGQKTALQVIHTLLNDYHEFSHEPLWTLYQKILKLGYFQFSKIRESKGGKSPSSSENYYKSTIYSNIALHVKIAEDASLHRTIHKAKGSEFDHVLVIVKGKDGYKYNEDRDLGFLLNPDIDGNEDHRVYYVACSRAMKNLFVNVPQISEKAIKKLNRYLHIQYV